mmetsp:Transcript_108495/g.248679  ORF Transcript_108495/g.248679 Transcript_108495/m.248679 type:complete len:116 (-) Transcript_108495:34-381(-)
MRLVLFLTQAAASGNLGVELAPETVTPDTRLASVQDDGTVVGVVPTWESLLEISTKASEMASGLQLSLIESSILGLDSIEVHSPNLLRAPSRSRSLPSVEGTMGAQEDDSAEPAI